MLQDDLCTTLKWPSVSFAAVVQLKCTMSVRCFEVQRLSYHKVSNNVKENHSVLGVGIGQIIAAVCLCTYYCSLIALTLYYLIASFNSDLPWSRCWESWGSNCIDSVSDQSNRIVNRTILVSSSEKYFL